MSDRIDLSALSVDRERFAALVSRIAAATVAQPPALHPVWLELRRYGTTAVAIAGLLAGVAWLPAWLTEPSPSESSLSSHAIAGWAHRGEVPADVDWLEETR